MPETNGCSVGCTDIAVRADTSPDVLWAAFGSFSKDGLYRSDDGGDRWIQYQTSTQQGRMTLAIAPSNNERMYILMAQNQSGWLGKLYSVFRSDDGGDSWYSSLDFDHEFSEWLLSYVAIATGCFEHPTIYSQGWHRPLSLGRRRADVRPGRVLVLLHGRSPTADAIAPRSA